MYKENDKLMETELKKFLDKYNTKGWKVLDIGHGLRNDFKNLFIKRGMEYFGIDNDKTIDINVVNKLIIKGEFSGGTYYYGDMKNMSIFPDNKFDLVFASHSFEHCDSPVDALREMKRVSKRFIYIITPFHCEHHLLMKGNNNQFGHIFVPTQLQMRCLFRYLNIPDNNIYVQMKGIEDEKRYNLYSIGKVSGKAGQNSLSDIENFPPQSALEKKEYKINKTCPGCGKEMVNASTISSMGFGRGLTIIVCNNKECKFYEIARVLLQDRIVEVKNEKEKEI